MQIKLSINQLEYEYSNEEEALDAISNYYKRRSLILLRGLPGSGKTRFVAKILQRNNGNLQKSIIDTKFVWLSVDQYFQTGTEYLWSKENLSSAHQRCISLTQNAMENQINKIIIDNANTVSYEYKKYIDLAKHYYYNTIIINLFDGGLSDEELSLRNLHKVPLEKIKVMRQRYERP